MKKITILGASGSIGTQTLDIIKKSNGKFTLNYLTVNKNIELLEKQLSEFEVEGVVITDEKSYKQFKKNTSFKGEILFGSEGLNQAASDSKNDILLSSLVGFAGVEPTIAAIKNNITIALANKETLVAAGKLISDLAKKHNVPLLPVDSEHSAIFQSLVGEFRKSIKKIILTASGGPFWNTPPSDFNKITLEQALKHPNWDMGAKITIDSATMMNKGFEVIEAYWLFDVNVEQIDVLIHPQSIIHSLVEFNDSSVKAQLGVPDMRLPIVYALEYPNRLNYDLPSLDLSKVASLEFHKPDMNKFRALKLAYQALEEGGTAPTYLNAANEVAVAKFLEKRINFIDIPVILEKVLQKININEDVSSIDVILNADAHGRILANEIIGK